MYGGAEVEIHTFLSSAFYGDELPALGPVRFNPVVSIEHDAGLTP
jgi:hypothetical protein